MCSSFNFLFVTSAAGFSGCLAGHLAGKDIQHLNCLEFLEKSQHRLSCIFHSNLLYTDVQGHMELQADPSMHWVVMWRHAGIQSNTQAQLVSFLWANTYYNYDCCIIDVQ